jgi:hypothetical protein
VKVVGLFVTIDVVVRRDDERGTEMKGNDDCGWSYDSVMLWLGMDQNRDVVE